MCTAEVFLEISIELFYLDHLLCNLSGLVNIQYNLGIPHHRIKCSAFTQTESRKKHKDTISNILKTSLSALSEQIKNNIQQKFKWPRDSFYNPLLLV